MAKVLSESYAKVYEDFLDYQKPRVSRQGFTTIAGIVFRVLKWFEKEELLLEDATVLDAIRFRKELSEKTRVDGNPVSSGCMCNYLKAARRLFTFLLQSEKIKTNPFEEIKNPQMADHLSRNVLTESQMNRLLEKLSLFDELATPRLCLRRYRCHVLSEFLYATGLRIAEACSLTQANVDTEKRLVYVPCGKGGKSRTAFLNCYSAEVMKLYLSKGKKAVLGWFYRQHEETLFGADKARVASVLNEELKAVCTELEIPVITSHGFRHSLGTHLLQHGCDMRHIQVILGHETIATTQIYTQVDKEDLRDSIDKFHPRRWIKDSGEIKK